MFPDISITADFDPLAAVMRAAAIDVLPEVAAIALTRTAIDVLDAEDAFMDEVFDRPTPFTRNGLRVYRATKDALAAAVWFKPFGDGAERHYLSPEAFGGARRDKAFEIAMRSLGLLPAGMQAVPGEGAHLDQYGNMSAAQLSQLLAYFRSRKGYTRARATRPAHASGVEYFVGRPGGHAPLGVWQRVPSAGGASTVKPIVIFVRAAHYRERLPFRETALRVVRDRLPVHFAQAWRDVAVGRLTS